MDKYVVVWHMADGFNYLPLINEFATEKDAADHFDHIILWKKLNWAKFYSVRMSDGKYLFNREFQQRT